ncbi:hypothetical protein COCON_G00140570 [Conger conger]|uniref:Uncharacterized protein n=1 Tax=Conger conger TaxID=82655 RepID=A0A9Q1DAR2_CONCO|nr:hypothetical protein COCON_G00140570 [Conger conger]
MKNTETEIKYLLNQPPDEVLQGGQEPIPACRREAGMHPGQVTSPLQSTRDIHASTDSFRKINLICKSIRYGGKPKYPEETQMDIEETYKHTPERKI